MNLVAGGRKESADAVPSRMSSLNVTRKYKAFEFLANLRLAIPLLHVISIMDS